MEPASRRRIASFGRRRGKRLRDSKQGLLDSLLPELAIDLPETGMLDVANLFPGKKSIQLEIGFGGGEHLAHQAALYPDAGFIGCETYEGGLASMMGHAKERALTNLRVYSDDARELMERLPEKSLSKVFVLYPDPWPKNRHHKRRIISTEFLDQLSRLMQPSAELRIATDHAPYATWMLERIIPHSSFQWTAKTPDDWLKPWGDWFSTRYEQKALAGIPTYLTFVKI